MSASSYHSLALSQIPLKGCSEIEGALTLGDCSSENLSQVEVIREAQLEVLVEVVNPCMAEGPLLSKGDLGLEGGILSELVLTGKVNDGWLSAKSLLLLSSIDNDLDSVN